MPSRKPRPKIPNMCPLLAFSPYDNRGPRKFIASLRKAPSCVCISQVPCLRNRGTSHRFESRHNLDLEHLTARLKSGRLVSHLFESAGEKQRERRFESALSFSSLQRRNA